MSIYFPRNGALEVVGSENWRIHSTVMSGVFWAKRDNSSAEYTCAVSKGFYSDAPRGGFWVDPGNGLSAASTQWSYGDSTDGTTDVFSDSTVINRQWQAFAWRINGDFITAYIDGVKVEDNTNGAVTLGFTTAYPLRIGAESNPYTPTPGPSSTSMYQGNLAHIGIWDTLLTDAELRA